jgi:hypothetical protein
MVFKGTISTDEDFHDIINTNEWSAGWTWKIAQTINFDSIWPENSPLEVGDIIIAIADHPDTVV